MISDIGGRRPTPTAYNSQPPRPREGDNSNLSVSRMNQTEVLNTFKTALNHGSGFESALGKAGILADADNKALMLRTWPFFLQKYGPSSALYKEGL
mgnify:FL=1|tara:strand:+ start:163 stop:450 length:288 start_codon:yes stop_codon:yes gene_type:complete